jgi:hypothetical protein
VFPRLKQHKFGSHYLLQPADVVIASYFPISRQVHQVRAIISREYDAERGEWITDGPFMHSTAQVREATIRELEAHFAALAAHKPWEHVQGYHEDTEEAVRRRLRFWINDSEVCAYLPRRSRWDDFQVTTEGVQAFDVAWRAVWDCFGDPRDLVQSAPSAAQD